MKDLRHLEVNVVNIRIVRISENKFLLMEGDLEIAVVFSFKEAKQLQLNMAIMELTS